MKIRRIEEKCTKCMLCVRDCVAGVWREVDGEPMVVLPEACNRCSHCIAICPGQAIEHEGLDGSMIRRVERKKIDPECYREIILSRRSMRRFKDEPVPDAEIREILDLAHFSPTATNSQHVGYIVVRDKNILRDVSKRIFGMGKKLFEMSQTRKGRIAFNALKVSPSFDGLYKRYILPMDEYIKEAEQGRDFILHGAPVLILIHAPAKAGFASENCNIAATNIMNYAHAKGMGGCYIGFLVLVMRFNKTIRRILQVPKGRKVFAAVILGYPEYRHTFTVSRKEADVKWVD